jgi:putative inorganic carbon (hco3(-)) transporter
VLTGVNLQNVYTFRISSLIRCFYDSGVAGVIHNNNNTDGAKTQCASNASLVSLPAVLSEAAALPSKSELWLRKAAFFFTFLSAASILLSIAASQIFLGAALVSLLLSRQHLRYPPMMLPLFLFFGATIIAVLLSGDPVSGLPQIRKFYVCLIVIAVFNTFTTLEHIGYLVLAWAAAGSASALASLWQFYHRYVLAHQLNANDYGFFLDGRIKGFAGHWMTFGGEEMIALLLLVSFLLFAPPDRRKWFYLVSVPLIWVAIVLGLTRSIFLLGVPVGVSYLLWHWKRWSVAALLVAAVLCFGASPVQVRERVTSVVEPHTRLDSNTHRVTTRRTGWEMVKAHPWFGLGPEQVGKQFLKFVPKDIPLPLPKGYYGHLHNIYLQYAAERGIPALLLMMWLITKAFFDFRKPLSARIDSRSKYVLLAANSVILAILAEGFFEYNLGDSEILTMFFVLIACGYIVLERVHATA